jgi:LacI family transcriptional regulator, repressor for deo operon, udp, cdd, tsx, nupC, and nupG
VREQGLLAGQMVLGLLRGEKVERAVIMPTKLIVRGSTAPPHRSPGLGI